MSKFLPIRPEWLVQALEPTLEPDLPIIDAHHHLWHFARFPKSSFTDGSCLAGGKYVWPENDRLFG